MPEHRDNSVSLEERASARTDDEQPRRGKWPGSIAAWLVVLMVLMAVFTVVYLVQNPEAVHDIHAGPMPVPGLEAASDSVAP